MNLLHGTNKQFVDNNYTGQRLKIFLKVGGFDVDFIHFSHADSKYNLHVLLTLEFWAFLNRFIKNYSPNH